MVEGIMFIYSQLAGRKLGDTLRVIYGLRRRLLVGHYILHSPTNDST